MLLWLLLCWQAQVAEHHVFGFIVKSYRHGSGGRHRGALRGGCSGDRESGVGLFVCWFVRLLQVMNPHVSRNYVRILKQSPGFCFDVLCILILIGTMRSKLDCVPVQGPVCSQQWHFSLQPGTLTLLNQQFLTSCPPPNTSHLNHTQNHTCSCFDWFWTPP